MTYQEAWTFLDRLQFHKIKLGLDSMNRFLGALDNPHLSLPCVHVGGTNGKGSVGSTLLSILSRAGYRVGLYTSPHLSSVRERFRINDQYISENDFAAEASRIKQVLNGGQITYFEFTTTLAMLWFARCNVDLAILEVGMGGRLDATNVVTPLVSVITNVSMDHEMYLGDTLEQVAGEKAGIIKKGVPLVSGVADDASRPVTEKTCREKASPLLLLGRDFLATKNDGENNNTWNYQGIARQDGRERRKFTDLPLALSGNYQLDNAAVGIATLEMLLDKDFQASEQDIRQGLQQVRWPGRLEQFWRDNQGNVRDEQPATDRESYKQVLLDGAHNPAGVAALREALLNSFTRKRLFLVWAAMADKNLNATLPPIADLADTIILTRPESERSAVPEELKAILSEEHQQKTLCIESVREAVTRALDSADSDDLVCIAGSLYLVGKARQILRGELTDHAA